MSAQFESVSLIYRVEMRCSVPKRQYCHSFFAWQMKHIQLPIRLNISHHRPAKLSELCEVYKGNLKEMKTSQ